MWSFLMLFYPLSDCFSSFLYILITFQSKVLIESLYNSVIESYKLTAKSNKCIVLCQLNCAIIISQVYPFMFVQTKIIIGYFLHSFQYLQGRESF